jgi:3D-(3,5/4)-trihydroxycyclohexane-1,2-dione acylhydrolase (decyclizing)
MNRFSRLTTGQALVRFMARQFVERDGRENRFIEGIWGIFGHGNVAGLGQGIVEFSQAEGLRFYRPQNEQAMVHTVSHFRLHNVHRTGRNQHDNGRCRCHREPHSCSPFA